MCARPVDSPWAYGVEKNIRRVHPTAVQLQFPHSFCFRSSLSNPLLRRPSWLLFPKKLRHSTGEQGDEDDVSNRDFAAGSSAAADPDRDEAKDLSSRASSDMGSPLLDPRGGNAADESVDDAGDDCPDDEGNVSGACKGLTRSG